MVVIFREGEQLDPKGLHTHTEMPTLLAERKLQSFLGIRNHLGNFLPSIAEVCKTLRELASSK